MTEAAVHHPSDPTTGPTPLLGEYPAPLSPAFWPFCLAVIAELALFCAALIGLVDWVAAIGLHVGICALLGLLVWSVGRRGGDVRHACWLVWMTLTLGPAGPVAAAALALMTLAFGRVAKPFDEWYDALFPDDEESESERLYRRLLSGREDAVVEGSVSSLTDVLFTGSTRAKQAVVALLARRFRSEFAPALRMALNDPEASIRVQAATAASTIEERYHNRRLELEAKAKKEPKEADLALDLARHLDDYAYAGVLDADRQQATMAAALDAYRQAYRLGLREERVDMAIGRLLLRLERNEEAERHLEELSRRASDSRAVLWHVECLFRLRRFDELRRRIGDRRLAELALSDEHAGVNPVINLWQISSLVDLSDLEGLDDLDDLDDVEEADQAEGRGGEGTPG